MSVNFGAWSIAIMLLSVIVNIILAFGVYNEAEKLKNGGGQLIFLGSFLWFVLTAIGGIAAAALFWVIHLSNLKK